MIVIEEIAAFFRKVPPFQFLEEATLRDVAASVSVDYYARGMVILRQDGPPSEHLRVIKKGGVRVSVFSTGGEEHIIDYRGEGDSFGILSLVGGDKSRANVVAAEDTICYLVRREMILKLIESNPAFTEFFLKSFFTKFIDKTYREMQDRMTYTGGSDRLLFSTTVGDLAVRQVHTAGLDTPIREAARIMAVNDISSLVMMEGGRPAGIITDRDLREKVVAAAVDFDGPVREIMTRSLVTVDIHDYCFEALLRMIHHGIHHLVVCEGEDLRGIVTNHDFMLLQGTSPLSIVKEIEGQQTIDGLMHVPRKLHKVVSLLLKEGAGTGNIIRIISEINDQLLRKVVQIAEKQTGPAPVRYCWIVAGSEGRKEQVFRTDQDNAIIYEDPAEGDEESVRVYFAGLSRAVAEGLGRCGFPPCPAEYVATNPEWRRPLSDWKRLFSQWVNEPTPEGIMRSLVFFDLRPVYGDGALATELQDRMLGMVGDKRLFLGNMANTITRNGPPLGFLKNFLVEKSGEHKDQLNLKVKGIAPLVDMIRLFSLERGVSETSTLERIGALRGLHASVREYADELAQVFEFLMLLRIHTQLAEIEQGVAPDNFINPNALTNLERKTIREAFALISRLQDSVMERYRQMII